MTEIYSVGTIAVTAGSVDFVGTGTGWLPPNAKAGDQVNVAGLMIGIAEITDATHGKFAIPYPGASGAGLPYAIFKTSSEWGTNRSLSMATADMIQLLSTLEVPNTGLRFDALGNFAGRSNYDDRPTAFGYLSLNGDGAGVTEPVVFAKLSGGDADWSAAILFRGGTGAVGPSGVIGNWRGPWVTTTAYALKDAVERGGSSYLCKIAHVAGDFATDLAAGRWELSAAKGAAGNDGVLSANEEIVTAASRTITAADNGKIFIANRAAGVTFNFDPVASLGTKWLGMFKNVGAGPLTIDPNGAELIDDVATLMLGTSESAMISANGALLRSHFRGSAGGKRELLTAPRTYYVRMNGSDANDGLANTAGGAFLTIQKALDVAAALDLSIYSVTINVADGTYAEALVAKPYTGAGPINLVGNTTTPANVVINSTGPSITVSDGIYTIDGFKVQATTWGLRVSNTGTLRVNRMNYGACGTGHMAATEAGSISLLMNYTISGGGSFHMFATAGGTVSADAVITATAIGTPIITTLLSAARLSKISIFNITTWSGAVTTTRYAVSYGALIDTGGSVLPGTGGAATLGGSYNGLIGGVREVLTANRTYFVRIDGSNSNSGLVNDAAGAFLTLQKAWDAVAALDLSIYTATIKVADGTYTAGLNMTATPVGGAGITIEGNTATPANVHVNWAGSSFVVAAPLPCPLAIRGFKTTFAAAGASAVRVSATGRVTVFNMELAGGSSGGFGGAYRADDPGAILMISTGQTISGNMSCLAQAIFGGVVQVFGITVTLVGTPAFSWLTVSATSMGLVEMAGVTFSGAATGTKYQATTAGGINTGGGGANYIPGTAATGSVTSPGWYL